ncbi:MAG: PIN domain-containing protein [Candidatus Eremiobacterota bacterium]
MSDRFFVDTNPLVYARDSSEAKKQPLAARWMRYLWQSRKGRLSFQVLQEYYVTVAGKLVPGLTIQEARAEVRSLLAWKPVAPDPSLLEVAWVLQDRHSISWWDALIVAAAARTSCPVPLSEDLQEGCDYDGVVVANPFRLAPPD